jgi:hypothetical protein
MIFQANGSGYWFDYTVKPQSSSEPEGYNYISEQGSTRLISTTRSLNATTLKHTGKFVPTL